MTDQSSLPNDLTSPTLFNQTAWATGHTRNRPPHKPTQRPPENEAPTLTDFMRHRFNSTTYTINTISQIIVGANNSRRFLSFQNNGTASVFLGFGIPSNVSGQNSFVLPVNGYLSFEFGIVPNNEIWAISTIAVNITIVEGGII